MDTFHKEMSKKENWQNFMKLFSFLAMIFNRIFKNILALVGIIINSNYNHNL